MHQDDEEVGALNFSLNETGDEDELETEPLGVLEEEPFDYEEDDPDSRYH